MDNYEYLTGEEILPSDQSRMIEQAKFTYSPLGKYFENKQKNIEDQGRKQIDAIMNQKEKQVGLSDNDDKNLSYKKYLKIFLKKDLMK